MSNNIGSIFDKITILWCHFLKKWKAKRFFELEMRWFCDTIFYAVTQLSGLAVNIAVNIKVGIHITK